MYCLQECLKRGEEWDPETFAKTKEEREAKEKQEAEEARYTVF